MTRIVTTAYRPKRPARKRKAVALAGPVVVRKRGRGEGVPPKPAEDQPTPANDDRKPLTPSARKPAIVATTSRKRTKLLRSQERAAAPEDDPEADAALRAWLERAKWGRGPA
jgi:hypothetical protein